MHRRIVHHFNDIMDWNSTILNNSNINSAIMTSGNAAHAQNAHNAEADAPIKYNLVVAIILGIILSVLDLTTILGNLLVCVTILSRRSLRNTTNYFILSLSSSDLLLGIIVLPFSTINTLLKKWPLGWIFCNIFISFDVMLCTVSILNLFVISLERYYAVTSPMNYVKILTFRRVCWIIAGIWLFSFVMAFLPIMAGFNTPSQKIQNMYNPSECIFEANKVYVLLVAIFTYFTPLFIMCAVYVRIFLIARRQVERLNTLVKSTIRMFDKPKAEKDPRFASDSKATVTLASVVTAFAICWIPYFVIFTARPFLPGPVDTHLDLFALWLGYVNSMLNPFLYAFHSTQFRRAFGGILLRRYDYNRTRTPYGQNV